MAEGDAALLYPLAVIIPILAGLVVLIDLPPLWWHIRRGNIGSGCLVLYLVTLNLMSFVNALIWPRDNFQAWFDGRVFCDIQVRLHLFASFGIGSSLVCVFKSLADVLDNSKTVISMSEHHRIKKMGLDILLCVGTPSVFILVYYVVQSQRYAIQGISGCVFMWDGTWVGIVLCMMWFPLLQVIAGFYAGTVIFRLVRYSRMFSTMLRNHSSTKSRFYRTFIMSLLMIICLVPTIIYNFYRAFPLLGPYSWDYTHSDWDTIYMYPSYGHVDPDVWGSLAGGVLMFVFFGTGQEALRMYRGWLIKIGAGNLWPSVHQEPLRSAASSDRWSFLGKRARQLFGKHVSTDFTDTSSHSTAGFTDLELALTPSVQKCPSPLLSDPNLNGAQPDVVIATPPLAKTMTTPNW